jgi:excisionase family DNA binding protein
MEAETATVASTVERAYLRYSEAEAYTGLHRVTLWRAVRDGHLKASGYGRAVRFHVRDLDAFMAARCGSEDG